MKKWIYSIFMLLFIFTLYGCSFTYEEELVIESIKTVLLDDGRTMIMISYTDEEIERFSFMIQTDNWELEEVKVDFTNKENWDLA